MANVGLAKHLADNWLIFPRIGKTRGKKTAEARKTWRRRRTRRRNARIKGREKEEEKEEEETRREGCRNSAPASLDLRVSRRWRQGGLIFYASFPPSRDPLPLPPLFGYSNPLSPLSGGGLRFLSVAILSFLYDQLGGWSRPKDPLAREEVSLYLHACHGLPSSSRVSRGRERKGGGEGEKDSRSEIRSIGLIGLRRHGLAASAPPIAYNTGGGYDLSPNIRPHLRQKWCASRSRWRWRRTMHRRSIVRVRFNIVNSLICRRLVGRERYLLFTLRMLWNYARWIADLRDKIDD